MREAGREIVDMWKRGACRHVVELRRCRRAVGRGTVARHCRERCDIRLGGGVYKDRKRLQFCSGGTNWGQSLVDTCAALGQAVGTAAALGKVEQIELSPLALTQLRITLFPWTTGTQKDDKL